MSNLGLVTDSDIAKLKSFEKAFGAIQKQLGSLSKIMPELNRVFSSYEKTISSLEKKNESLVKKVDSLTAAQDKQRAASEANSGILVRQKSILDGMVAGYSRGEASILATAKATGVASGAFKELERVLLKQRDISGKNPFDDTISATRKLEREIQLLDAQFDSLSKGISFSKAEASEYVRTMAKAKAAAEAMAGDPAEFANQASYAKFVNKVIQEQTQDYKRLSDQKAQLKKRNDDLVSSQEKEARAQARTQSDLLAVEKQLKRTRIEAELAREGLSRVTATGVAGLQLRGASAESINSYKQMRLEIEKIQKEAYRTGGALRGLSTIGRELFPALGAVGVVATFGMLARKVILTTDAYNLLSARIKLVSSENEKFTDVQERLLSVATNTRQSFEAIGKLYARLVPALQAVGGSSTDAMIAAEQLAGSLTKSGTSVQEAESAILQFSQALGSGKLAGDEFRSLAEAAPDFMRGLAKALGVPTTSMKQLAAEGKLTTEVVSAGTIIMAESFKSLGESMPITVGQAFQQLTNVLFIRTSELNNALGGNQGLAESVLNLAKSFDSGLQSLTNFVKENEDFISGIFKGVAVVSTALGIFGAWKLLLLALTPATVGFSAATLFANKVLLSYAISTTVASRGAALLTASTTALSLSIRGLISSTGIGLVIAGLATAYIYLSDSSDEATKSQKEVAEATKASAKRLEEAKRTAKLFSDEVTGLARGSLPELIAASDKLYESQLKLNDEGLKLAMGMNDQEFALYKLEAAYESASAAEQSSLYWKTEQTAVILEQMIQQQKLNDAIKLSTDEEKDYKEQSANLRKEINERTKSSKELAAIELQLLSVKAATIEADILALNSSKDFNFLTQKTIESRMRALEALRETIALTQQLNNTPEKPKESKAKEIDEYKKLNESIKDYIDSLSAKSEGLSKAQVYELEYSKLKGKTTAKIRESIEANIAEAKSLELLDNLKKARIDREKELEEFNKNSKGTIDELQAQIDETIYQTKIIGLNTDAIRDLELAKIDDMITTLEYQAVVKSMTGEHASEVKAIETQINLYRQLRKEKAKQFIAQSKDDTAKKEKKILEDQQKEYEKIFEEVGQIFGEALFKGGDDAIKDLGKNIKNYFKTLTIRLAIEPAMKNVGQQAMNLFSGKDFDAASLGNSLGQLASGSNGGMAGALLNKGLSSAASNLNDEGLRLIGEGFTSMGTQYANLGSTLGTVASYAGSIVQLMEGNVKGAALTAAGTYIGGAIAGPIGAAVGSYLGGMLGGSGKISAKGFGAEFGQNISKALGEQYLQAIKSLGGADSGVSFNAWGNTGRQGQNNNFTLSASRGGRGLFNSANTKEGQADGLFLSGEIALNDVSLADQSLRALFAAFKETDFADNIDALISKVDLFSATTEELNATLVNAQALADINKVFGEMEGVLSTLSGQSYETLNSFLLLVGGIDGLVEGNKAFYDAFTRDSKKADDLLKSVSKVFVNFGQTLPSTRDELVSLVDSLDLRNESDRRLYATILQLTPALNELLPAFEEINQVVETTTQITSRITDAFETLRDSVTDAESDLLDAFTRESDEIRNVIGSFDDLIDSLKDFREGIKKTIEVSSLGSLQSAKKRFSQATSATDIISSGNALAEAAANFSKSRVDYIRELAAIEKKALTAQQQAEGQKTVAEQQLQSLTDQVAQLITLNEVTLSVQQAIANLTTLQSLEAEAVENALLNGFGNLLDTTVGVQNAVDRGTSAALLINQSIAQLVSIEAERKAQEDATAARQEAERQKNSQLANINNQALQIKDQVAKGAEIRSQSTSDLGSLQKSAYDLASQFGVFLNASGGSPQLANTAKFGVDQDGNYSESFGQIAGGSGYNFGGFKNEFYKSGGIYEKIQAEANSLAEANQLINSESKLLALRQQVTDLGGIPAFAKGGDYQGGLALVGEKGPEVINFNQGGRVSSNKDTTEMMKKANKELVEEVKSLKEVVKLLLTTTQQGVINTGKATRILEDVTQNGTSISTVVA